MMQQIDLIVIGGSAGGLHALSAILPHLPAGYPIPLLVIMHRNSSFESSLIDLLNMKSSLIVKEVEEKDDITAPAIYLAPADYHVLIETDNTFSLDYSEKIHFCRPSIDVSFQSAASHYKSNVAGIVLSGSNADGAAGLADIGKYGGLTVVQDPSDAEVNYMPLQAIRATAADHILAAHQIGELLNKLAPNKH